MRLLSSCLVIAGLLAGQAQAECIRPADTTAFEVTGLKTRLMVTALTCDANSKYNDFVTRYRPELTSEDRALNTYFSRVHGRASAKQRDDYVTQLANSESQTGLKQGSLFCNTNLPIFDEVMALRGGAELANYAGAKSVGQPIATGGCNAEPAPTRATTTTTPRRRR